MDERKLIDDSLIDYMDDHNDMIKSDNIECCVCMDFHIGVKLPNCNHFICFKCYYKMYNGYVSYTFYINNPEPKYLKKPIYPYTDINKNLEIYNNLTDDNTFLDFFLNENEDLYNCINNNEDFIKNINTNVIIWFKNNELIINYENDLIQYNNDLIHYYNELDIYCKLIEEERVNNINNKCPLCRM